MIVGCGEWGFRNVPMEEHFRISDSFGFKFLEFGIGGGQPGRLSEEPSEAEIAEFTGEDFDTDSSDEEGEFAVEGADVPELRELEANLARLQALHGDLEAWADDDDDEEAKG